MRVGTRIQMTVPMRQLRPNPDPVGRQSTLIGTERAERSGIGLVPRWTIVAVMVSNLELLETVCLTCCCCSTIMWRRDRNGYEL